MPSIIIHISNEDPVLGEIDELPAPTDAILSLKNPRRRDGKDLHYLEPNVSIVMFPLTKINFIEVLSGGEDEDIVTFVRE
jgi:hypothetical protein